MKLLFPTIALLLMCGACANQRSITSNWQLTQMVTANTTTEKIAADEAQYSHSLRSSHISYYDSHTMLATITIDIGIMGITLDDPIDIGIMVATTTTTAPGQLFLKS